ncbi:MAG: RNA polymerase sigma-70 factor [Rikenellaceae bacterium]
MKALESITMNEIEKVYFELYPRLCVFAYKILKDSDLAKNAVQEVFLTVFEKKDKLQINISLQSYLVKAVYNRCLLDKRKKSIHQKHSDSINYEKLNDCVLNEEFDDEDLAKLELLDRAIKSLPEQCRKVFLLNKKEGLSYAKIAVQVGISVKTVDNHISKAMKRIKEFIGNI